MAAVGVIDQGGGGLMDRWLALRDRLLAAPAFQHWAVRFPLTRPIANRRARALFDICTGFVYSQVLAACVQLRLFELLADGPRSAEWVAERLSLRPTAAFALLQAASGLRLVERRRDGSYGLGVLGAATLGNPGIAAMVEHHALLYADLRDPVALLRGEQPDTALGRLWPYAGGGSLDANDVADYSRLMAASQPLVAADILAACRLDRHSCLLDLGGGDGTFLTQAAIVAPTLRLMLLDLPAVAERARARFADAGLAGRAETFAGDFRTGPLPPGADVISLIRVIHDHDDDTALAILRNARAALPSGGTLLLAEPMAETPGAETVGAYFTFYLLAMGSGRPRSAATLSAMLCQAGFSRVDLLSTRRPMLVRVLRACC
jgi:demethylspheroidene O-methyltransferase